ncbi:hypothetical protein PC123_g510 [Phytophthora cactorum]|nr:hypothetical protein PC123_g510 [Phytophthora cactorum]
MPSSSCQIERDFGISGNMATPQRTSLADHNVDMCSILNRNDDFVDLLQCEAIPKGEHHLHTPKSFVYAVDEDMDVGLEHMPSDLLAEFMPSTSLGDEWGGWGEEEEKSSFRCVRAATAAVSSMLSSPSSTHGRTSRPAPTTTATATTIESSRLVVRVHTLPSPYFSKTWRPQRRKLSPQAPSAQRTLPLPLECQCAGSATRGGRPGGAHEDRRGRPQSASLHGHARRRVVRGLREHAVPSQKKTSLEDDGVDDSSKEITTYYSKHHNGADHVQRSGGALAATHGQSVVLAQLKAQFRGEDADEGDQVGGGPPSGTLMAPALARFLW